MVTKIVPRQDPPFRKKTGGLFMYPPSPTFPHLKRWCLVCIAPALSGVETKKRFKPPYAISPAMRASCTVIANMKVSTQILRPINSVQTSGILHSSPYPYARWVLIEYTCYDHFPYDCPVSSSEAFN